MRNKCRRSPHRPRHLRPEPAGRRRPLERDARGGACESVHAGYVNTLPSIYMHQYHIDCRLLTYK